MNKKPDTEIDYRLCRWQTHKADALKIRDIVFCQEQNVSEEDELDGLDTLESTYHFIAFHRKQPIATVRLLNSGQIGRLAVLKKYRKQGIGLTLLKKATEAALEQNKPKIFVHAQTHAIDLYQKIGYRQQGDIFLDANIEHQEMVFNTQDSNAFESFYADKIIRLTSPRTLSQHIAQIAQCSLRYLDIMSHHLNREIFSEERLTQTLLDFAQTSRNAQIRILLQNSKSLWNGHHTLLNLSHRLPSKIEIRVLTEAPPKPEAGYISADLRRLVYMNNEEAYEGFVNYMAPQEAQNYVKEFETYWQLYSKTDPNLAEIRI